MTSCRVIKAEIVNPSLFPGVTVELQSFTSENPENRYIFFEKEYDSSRINRYRLNQSTFFNIASVIFTWDIVKPKDLVGEGFIKQLAVKVPESNSFIVVLDFVSKIATLGYEYDFAKEECKSNLLDIPFVCIEAVNKVINSVLDMRGDD